MLRARWLFVLLATALLACGDSQGPAGTSDGRTSDSVATSAGAGTAGSTSEPRMCGENSSPGEDGLCYCDEGHDWCTSTGLDCCELQPKCPTESNGMTGGEGDWGGSDATRQIAEESGADANPRCG